MVSFNKGYVKKLSKQSFVSRFKNIYPSVDLEAVYDEIVPPKREKSKEKEEPKDD